MIARPLAGACLAIHALPALAPIVPTVANVLAVPRRLDSHNSVFLTFDDGPHPQGTPAVLNLLAKAGATATFFLVGEQVERRPQLAAEIAAAGHGVAIHCHRHRNHLRLHPRQITEDLNRAQECISEATDLEPRLYRPPYGIFSGESLALVRRRGWWPLLWSAWGRDWRKNITAERIAALATRGLGPGSVILLHDADYYSATESWQRTVAALPRIIDEVAERGLEFEAVPGEL